MSRMSAPKFLVATAVNGESLKGAPGVPPAVVRRNSHGRRAVLAPENGQRVMFLSCRPDVNKYTSLDVVAR